MTELADYSWVHARVKLSTGIEMHFVERGQGPCVILCHGWPEFWYSWRHQV